MDKSYIIREGDSVLRWQVFALKVVKSKNDIVITDYSLPKHIREHNYHYDDDMSYYFTITEKIRYSYQETPMGHISTLQMIQDIVVLAGTRKWKITRRPWSINNKINFKLLVELNKANKKYSLELRRIPKDEILRLISLA